MFFSWDEERELLFPFGEVVKVRFIVGENFSCQCVAWRGALLVFFSLWEEMMNGIFIRKSIAYEG